jgi:outer membrane autotransporter protein
MKILAVSFLLLGAIEMGRADNNLEANGPTEDIVSILQIYSTSTATPAMLATNGGKIFSLDDLVTILPPSGLIGLEAQGLGSQITADNLHVLGLGLDRTGLIGATAINGGSIILNGGSIEILGESSFGLLASNGTISANRLAIDMTGINSQGAAAEGGSITFDNSSITTTGLADNGLQAVGVNSTIFGTNLAIMTSGAFGSGAEADNGGLIVLNNATIEATGVGAYALTVSGPGSSLALIDSDVTSTLGSGALVENSGRLILTNSNLTALIHGIVASGGTASMPNSIIVNGGSVSTVIGDAFTVQNGATNIDVVNGANIMGNSSLLRVVDPGTVVDFQASNATLTGNIFANPASQTTVNLTNGTVLTGFVNPPLLMGPGVDLNIDGSSEWVLTESSSLKSLNVNPGAEVVFSPSFFFLHRILTLGSLSGTGGIFDLNISLFRQAGDLIDIIGPSAGSHLLDFTDVGLATDIRRNAALLVVETSDGVAGFSGMTDGAVFKYYVVHGDGSSLTPNPDDWYLVRADQIVEAQITRRPGLPAGSIDTPVGLSTADALTNAANAAIGTYAAGIPLFYADLDTLSERLGELRLLEAERQLPVDPDGKGILPATAPPEPAFGSWVRGFGSGMTINDQVSRTFDQNIGGFQFGADRRFAVFNGDLYVGGFLGYLYASRDFLDGSTGTSNEISVGAYSTWVNPQGWYADLVFKYSQLWNYLNAPGSNGGVSSGSYTIASVGGSLEIGKRFDLGHFFIEPQAQLAGVWESGNGYTESNGVTVGFSDQYSLRGRLGLRAGMHLSLGNGIILEPYLKVSAVHEFLTGDQITLDDIPFQPTISGTLVDAGAGIAARLNQSVYLYGEYDYANGDKIREPWSITTGLRWQWGGAAQQTAVIEPPSGKESIGKQVQTVASPEKPVSPWVITVGAPGWLASTSGISGFHGVNSDISVNVIQLLRHLNFIWATNGEIRNGPYSLFGGFLYANAQAGISGTGLVSRVGVGLQEFFGQAFASYRIIDNPHGSLDLLAGFRFTYLGQQVGLNPNVTQIDAASTQLVDLIGQQITTPGSNIRNLIQQTILSKLSSLDPNHPTLPVAPIGGQEPGQILALLQQFIQSQEPELAAAIRAHAQGRVNQLKTQIASQIANIVTNQLNRNFSFYDEWADPLIGLRGRFSLTKAFYLTGQVDVGGFGIGSDIAAEAYGALGCQVTRNIRAEVGYRYYYDDFRDEESHDFLYQMSVYGPQITASIDF